MKQDINLLSQRQRSFTQKQRSIWIATVASIGLLVLSAAVAVLTLSIKLVKTKQLKAEESQIQSLQQRIGDLSQVEQRQQLLVNRLESAKTILASRPNIHDRIKNMADTFPDGVQIASLEINGTKQPLTIQISSPTFDGFYSSIRILNGGGFKKVDVESIARGQDGEYQVTLAVTDE